MMRNIARCLSVLGILASVVFGGTQWAQAVPAYSLNLPGSQPVDGDTGQYTMGFQFTISQEFQIDALGYNANNQFAGQHRIGIFDIGTQAVLASADVLVPSGNSNLDDFVYQNLVTPLVLPAGTYAIAGTTYNYPSSGSAYGYIFSNDNSHYIEAAGITYGDGAFTNSTGDLAYPSTLTSNNFYNVNFQFSAVLPSAATPIPEPTSLALCGIALAICGYRRRQSKVMQR